MLAIVMQGALRDGITTWMPTYIVDTFNLSSSASILTAVAMPLFSVISFRITVYIYTRWIRNEVICGGVLIFSGFISSIVLMFTFSKSVLLSVFMSTLITGGMHGANLMLVCMVPARLAKFGKASTASGVLNSCTYIGSALSTYGIALVAEHFGWAMTIGLWAVVALAGTLACVSGYSRWQRFLRNSHEEN
jgi:OPA family glycerol-3-phosphate transporter-like MFS transporter